MDLQKQRLLKKEGVSQVKTVPWIMQPSYFSEHSLRLYLNQIVDQLTFYNLNNQLERYTLRQQADYPLLDWH